MGSSLRSAGTSGSWENASTPHSRIWVSSSSRLESPREGMRADVGSVPYRTGAPQGPGRIARGGSRSTGVRTARRCPTGERSSVPAHACLTPDSFEGGAFHALQLGAEEVSALGGDRRFAAVDPQNRARVPAFESAFDRVTPVRRSVGNHTENADDLSLKPHGSAERKASHRLTPGACGASIDADCLLRSRSHLRDHLTTPQKSRNAC